jgi:hypothetical protein
LDLADRLRCTHVHPFIILPFGCCIAHEHYAIRLCCYWHPVRTFLSPALHTNLDCSTGTVIFHVSLAADILRQPSGLAACRFRRVGILISKFDSRSPSTHGSRESGFLHWVSQGPPARQWETIRTISKYSMYEFDIVNGVKRSGSL